MSKSNLYLALAAVGAMGLCACDSGEKPAERKPAVKAEAPAKAAEPQTAAKAEAAAKAAVQKTAVKAEAKAAEQKSAVKAAVQKTAVKAEAKAAEQKSAVKAEAKAVEQKTAVKAEAPAKAVEQKPAVKAEAPAKADVWASLPEVVAEIDGKPLTRKEISDLFMSQFPGGETPAFLTPELVAQVAPELVRQVVQMKLIDADIAEKGFKATPEQIREFLKNEIAKIPPQQLENIKKQLAMQNKTLDQHIDSMVANPEVCKGVGMNIFAQQTFLKGISPATDAEIKEFYEKNKKELFTNPGDAPDTVRASHILVMTDDKTPEDKAKAAKEKIEKIAAELKAHPEKFAEIAKTQSQCPSRERGGELGAFAKGQMVPEFEQAAFALKEGEISGIVKTRYGYHIIRRDAAQKETVRSLDEVKAQIADILREEREAKALNSYIEKLEKAHQVKILVKAPEEKKAAAPEKK